MRKLLVMLWLALVASQGYSQVLYWDLPASPDRVALGDGSFFLPLTQTGASQNPAYLGMAKCRWLSAAGTQWWQEVYAGSADAIEPFGRWGAASLSLGYWSLGSVTRIDDDGQPLGTIQSQASLLGLGYGLALDQRWMAGIYARASRLGLPDRYDWGWSSDVAMGYRQGIFLASMVARNLGPEYPRNNEVRRPLPSQYTVGLRASLLGNRAAGSLHYSRSDGQGYPGLSLEYSPIRELSLKLGYERDPVREERSPLGLGLEVMRLGQRDLSIGYGFRSFGGLGQVHSISLGACF